MSIRITFSPGYATGVPLKVNLIAYPFCIIACIIGEILQK